METMVSTIIKSVPESFIPFVLFIIGIAVIVVGCFYIYILFSCKKNSIQMNIDKEQTRIAIDKEAQKLRDLCNENSIEIKYLKEDLSTKNEILDTLRSQVNELNVNLAIVSERIVTLVKVIKELKK